MAGCTTGCSSCLSAAEYSCCSSRELLECIALSVAALTVCNDTAHATSGRSHSAPRNWAAQQ
eukprot:10896-Heterococcus_DN1.PRE.1